MGKEYEYPSNFPTISDEARMRIGKAIDAKEIRGTPFVTLESAQYMLNINKQRRLMAKKSGREMPPVMRLIEHNGAYFIKSGRRYI